MGLALVGAAIGAAGTIVSGVSASNAQKYQAQVAENNAAIARQNAEYAMQAGHAETEKTSLKGAANLSNIKAGQAASGVDINSGSAVDVQASQRETNKLDSETTLNNAQLKAYGYRTQETGFKAEAQLNRAAATSTLIGTGFSAAGGLLGSASSLSPSWSGSDFSGNSSSLEALY